VIPPSDSAEPAARGGSKLTMRRLGTPLAVLALIGGTFWLWFTQMDGSDWQLHHTIGAAITAPSWLLWARSRYDLGASFAVHAEARALVTHGIYSRIRHPIYLFGECVSVGVLVFLGHPVLLLFLAVTIPMQVTRARREEQVLDAAFGRTFREHRARTWF